MPGFGRPLLVFALVLLLCACGFRLAGTGNLPQSLNSIYLVTRNFDESQARALRERLERAGAAVSLQPLDGAVRLSVALKTLPDRRLATGASTGKKVNRISRRLDFSLRDGEGRELLSLKSLSQQKDIVLDDDNLLSSGQERDGVVTGLEHALYNLLIHQLRRI